MILSGTSNRVNSRWLQTWFVLIALVVLPPGSASAQDYKAVGKRLGKAVGRGELTFDQAVVMMDALKRASGAKKHQESDGAKAHLTKVKKELGELVEAGKISKEDAAKRLKGASRAIKQRMAAGRGESRSRAVTREDYARVEAELKKLVAEGKISEEGMVKRLYGMRKEIAEKSEHHERSERGSEKHSFWEGIRRRIEGAVEMGMLTREQANEKYKEIRERMAGSRDE